jgi:hypothetical protein
VEKSEWLEVALSDREDKQRSRKADLKLLQPIIVPVMAATIISIADFLEVWGDTVQS